MIRKIPIIIQVGALLVFAQLSSFAQGRVVVNGARITLADSAYLVTTDVSLTSGSVVTVNRSNIKVAGTVTSAGTLDVTNGGVEMNGTTAQVLPANVFSGNLIKNLIINNTAGTTLNGTLGLTNVLNVANGQFSTGNFLTLKSSLNATAVITRITSAAATPITGNVTVERYIPLGKRAYRNLTPGVNTASNTYANWQNGGTNTPGIGTHITGSTSGASGFDATYTGAYSLFTYTPGAAGFTPVTSTNGVNDKLSAVKGYRLFIRGDRSAALNANTNSGVGTPNIPMNAATTLKTMGTVITGGVTYNKTATSTYLGSDNTSVIAAVQNAFTMIGNPYWCPVDFNALIKTDIKPTYWIWDPSIGNRGAYTSYTTGIGSSGGGAINQYIQPGQAVFIQNLATPSFTGNPALSFAETNKVISFTNTFRTAGQSPSALKVSLYTKANIEASGTMQDASSVYFRDDFTNSITAADADKFVNPDENLALVSHGSLLGMEARVTPNVNDTIPVKIWNLFPVNEYVLRVDAADFDATTGAYVLDALDRKTFPLNLNGSTDIPFKFTNDTTTFQNRFSIVFRPLTTLAVAIKGIQAYIHHEGVKVEWQTAESDMLGYEIERSADGNTFEKIGFVKALNTGAGDAAYDYFDAAPLAGYNYYRVKSVGNDGHLKYSKIVRVRFSTTDRSIKILSNPVTGSQIRMQLNNLPKGSYEIVLLNSLNQEVMTQKMVHNGQNTAQTISMGRQPGAGIYQLVLRGSEIKLTERIVIR